LQNSDAGPFPYKKNIFYVKPDGNDSKDGLSIRNAWKTLKRATRDLKSGDTLYLSPGSYQAGLSLSLSQINLRGRGIIPAIIRGRFELKNAKGVKVDRLCFTDEFQLTNVSDSQLTNCTFKNFKTQGGRSLTVNHCLFSSTPEFSKVTKLYLTGNLYATGITADQNSFTYSDYNSYPDETALKGMPDQYSLVIKPDIQIVDKVPIVQKLDDFAGRGPDGTAIGIYNAYRKQKLRIDGPFIHSVSDTTANIEFWLSQIGDCVFSWGETAECNNQKKLTLDKYASFSLTGLKPETKYYFRIKSIMTGAGISNMKKYAADDSNFKTIAFTTAAAPKPAKTYYVAKNGNDRNTGFSRKQAFKTITQAAAVVNAGDTVLVSEGIYEETIRMRATGYKGRPITFKSLPGEKVTIDGAKRKLPYAFKATGKSYLHFDGFYILGQGNAGSGGAFQLTDCDNITITRCFVAGWGHGYPCLSLLNALRSSGILIKNCFASTFMEVLHLRSCTNVRFENNVSFVNLIMHANIANLPDEKVYFSKNILTDSQRFKLPVCTYEIARFDSFVDENNCYFLRVPDEKRKMFFFCNHPQGANYGPDYARLKPPKCYGRVSLKDFYKAVGKDGGSFVRDPKFKGLIGIDVSGVTKKGEPVFPPDKMPRQDSDFDDYFTTDPDLIKRGIGLQPEVFKDFKFKPKKKNK